MKPIPGFPGYYATPEGCIFSERSQRRLKPRCNGNRYLKINVGRAPNGRPNSQFVHRLIASAWHPNPENLPLVNHKDRDRRNNRPDNLEWIDHAGNARHWRNDPA